MENNDYSNEQIELEFDRVEKWRRRFQRQDKKVDLKMKAEIYYFAYGSNLNVHQMTWRCPFARKVGKAVLNNYRLSYDARGFADIKYDRGYKVTGGLWKVSLIDLDALDSYEGYPHLYYRKPVPVYELPTGKNYVALTYLQPEPIPRHNPSAEYMRVVIKGMKDFGISIPKNILEVL